MNNAPDNDAEAEVRDAELRREAARAMGRARTEKKVAASRENGKKGGTKCKPLTDIACTCGRTELDQHPTTCPRGRAIRYRTEKGLPLT